MKAGSSQPTWAARVGRGVLGALLLLAPAHSAEAYSCRVVIREAEELIASADSALTGTRGPDRAAAERALVEARRLVVEATHEHEAATARPAHTEAIQKAQRAKAFAAEARTRSER